MSLKLKISYTEDQEAQEVMHLLAPLLGRFKVKSSTGTPPYRHIYLNPKSKEEPVGIPGKPYKT